MNKKLGRFKQWAGERMGGEVKTSTSDDFKALEAEMTLRHEGMEKLQKSMTIYVKSLSKRTEVEDREKALPAGYLGSTMVSHGEDFEPDSEFGNCLTAMGRANERIARHQESYVANATSTWLESLERSLVQMKEYQAARKKLEQRRLAYDTSLSKMQKAKREDFRVEEELRAQKAKYEESNEDIYRRMQDIKESELDSIADLTAFLDAELAFHEKCRDVLLHLKRDWPGRPINPDGREIRHTSRPRSNTAHSYSEPHSQQKEEPLPDPRLVIPKLPSRTGSPRPGEMLPPPRTLVSRSNTMDPPSVPRTTRVPTDPTFVVTSRAQLRPTPGRGASHDLYADVAGGYESTSPDRSYMERSASPATSHGSGPSRQPSWSKLDSASSTVKKAPPPPPPSRSKKPPPPPPPMKRSVLNASDMSHA